MIANMTEADFISNVWSNTIQLSGCWRYQGCKVARYGIYKNYRVHRVSAYLFHGLDMNNPKLEALHKIQCYNRDCWCPDHIYVGTSADNNRDRALKITKCSKGHPYDEQNTSWRRDGKGRECKECQRIRSNDYGKRKRRKLNPEKYKGRK